MGQKAIQREAWEEVEYFLRHSDWRTHPAALAGDEAAKWRLAPVLLKSLSDVVAGEGVSEAAALRGELARRALREAAERKQRADAAVAAKTEHKELLWVAAFVVGLVLWGVSDCGGQSGPDGSDCEYTRSGQQCY